MPTKKASASKTRRSSSAPRKDAYALITEKLIEAMDRGEIPWRKTWAGGEARMPRSLNTGRPYRGANLFLLAMVGRSYDSPYWLTYKQAKTLGGSVRKGEKGTPIIFWSGFDKKDAAGEIKINPETGKPERAFFLRHYTVFNLDQTDDVRIAKGRELPEPITPGGEAEDEAACAAARSIFESYTEREAIKVMRGGSRACFAPSLDAIQLPKIESFECEEDSWTTALHEATHSTGTADRLDRPGVAEFDHSGSHQYADEELVAEFGASFLCGMAGIDRDDQIENSAAYLAHWKARAIADPKLLVYAAQRAQKAADFILDAKAPGATEEA